MDIRKIRKLIELMNETHISEIEIKEGEETLRLSRHSTVVSEAPVRHAAQQIIHHAPASPSPAVEAPIAPAITGHTIRSPMVGTMYTSPSPESPPFVTVGQTVKAGEVLCIVEAMKMFNEIEADRAGKIVNILVSSGDPVEYDQPLFILEEL